MAKKSLGANTYRGFHRIDKLKSGSKNVFESVLFENKNLIIDSLNNMTNEDELNLFSKQICEKLLIQLRKNIVGTQLQSFNKIRKPIDIVFEHFIAMGEDFSHARNFMVKHLFLPLDSQMFQSCIVFSDEEIKKLAIKRNFTFKDINNELHYQNVQKFLKNKATEIGLNNRIYFDLLWNERYNSSGKNLFQTNPA